MCNCEPLCDKIIKPGKEHLKNTYNIPKRAFSIEGSVRAYNKFTDLLNYIYFAYMLNFDPHGHIFCIFKKFWDIPW
jgi:hypothetical protein